ncbi:hypothetical protein M501DRAFT_981381 [Patellaria atrata CBS 101060]|uniref:Transcription initiation factor TFIID subunit 12 domain-containing protein n=1 Tax=Patellaria atrata CBS 101060 TaxID=1346257 RepID=A0A9P4S3F5_9PEZI|nr:hypothetical protein M501DRAFT_981381 [Patellaria atrata CBS 101060]
MNNPGASQGPQAGVQPRLTTGLLRPEQLQVFGNLTDAEKAKYAEGLKHLWGVLNNNSPDTDQHKQARAKLEDATGKLTTNFRRWQASQHQQKNTVQQSANRPNNPVQAPQQEAAQQPQQQTQGRPEAPAVVQQIPPAIQDHVRKFPFALPPEGFKVGTPEYEAKVANLRNSYTMMLMKMESHKQKVQHFGSIVEQRRQQGQDATDALNAKTQEEARWGTIRKQIEEFRAKQSLWKQQQQAHAQQAQQQQNVRQAQQVPQAQPQGGNNIPPGNQTVHAARDQANNRPGSGSPATGGPPQQHPQQAQAFPPSGLTNTQQNSPQVPQMPNQQANINAGIPRPQLNPQQVGQPAQTQQSPHTAQAPNGPPVPLSHQAAMTAAARTYSNPQQTPQGASGQSGYQQMGNRENSNVNPKMPIPKQLNVSQPAPVTMGPSRPTMGGPSNGPAGMMGQPVIAKTPQFALEGDGERVLSKKKLDDLVRQVTGGGEGVGGEMLAPDAEDVLLQLADDFVDNVITAACKLAKLRDSSTLEIRDIQLILERNYNIRIPGYASDEVRTVRKFHPTAGWTAKMNAVQAAKVMGGKTDL